MLSFIHLAPTEPKPRNSCESCVRYVHDHNCALAPQSTGILYSSAPRTHSNSPSFPTTIHSQDHSQCYTSTSMFTTTHLRRLHLLICVQQHSCGTTSVYAVLCGTRLSSPSLPYARADIMYCCIGYSWVPGRDRMRPGGPASPHVCGFSCMLSVR